MATVTIKMHPDDEILYDRKVSGGEYKMNITAHNIDALKAAIQAYEEETKLPETMEDARTRLTKMFEGSFSCIGTYGTVETHRFDVGAEVMDDDANIFPHVWQAEKLHALACMEQVWIVLNQDGFDWQFNENSFCFVIKNREEVLIDEIGRGFDRSAFPFRTRELAEQARRILGDDLIKKAFSVK